jgi:hypothetical protein
VDDHVFFIGREYGGPHSQCFTLNNINIPRGSRWDVGRAVTAAVKRLQIPGVTDADVRRLLNACDIQCGRPTATWPTMTDAYKARKALNGLVIGPLDKNNGELWACCPVLYERALTKLYSKDMGYVEETPRRVTPARLRRHGPEGITRYAIQPRPPRRRDERGSMADVLSAWGHLYRARGWGKYGRFDTKCGAAPFGAAPGARSGASGAEASGAGEANEYI